MNLSMRQSALFGKTLRNIPKDEISVSAQYLIRGSFIDKLMAGVYTYLPIGWRVYKRIEDIIRIEMDAIGGQELFMPVLHPKSLWDETGRWKVLEDVMYRVQEQYGKGIALGCTHEEIIFDIVRRFIQSYRDLPLALYQIQTKFRYEPRARSGLLRGREFSMKDLYSFHAEKKDLDTYYQKVADAYRRIFIACGIPARMVEASGGTFTKEYSHEFQVPTDAGEDKIVCCEKCDFAQNTEIFSGKKKTCPVCGGCVKETRSIEVGNIFRFYDKYAKDMDGYLTDKQGNKRPILMASYGIGLGRAMATIVELHHDDRGITWPLSVAPFSVHLLVISHKDGAQNRLGEKVFSLLDKKGISTLYDDREASAGEKLADADLIGIPFRVVAGKGAAEGRVEVKKRSEDKAVVLAVDKLCSWIQSESDKGEGQKYV